MGPFLVGMGMAFLVFNFLTGNGNIVNAMAGVIGLGLAIRSLRSRAGSVWKWFSFIGSWLSKGQESSQFARIMLAGYGSGSAMAIILSLISWPYLFYVLGGGLLLVGVIYSLLQGVRKEVVT